MTKREKYINKTVKRLAKYLYESLVDTLNEELSYVEPNQEDFTAKELNESLLTYGTLESLRKQHNDGGTDQL